MFDPAERQIFACRTCFDHGWLANGRASVKCPECSGWDEYKRKAAFMAETARRGEKPTISAADLTQEEKDLVAMWEIDHPHTNRLTLLTWIEGRRYDPSKDADFIAEARKKFKKWQFLRNSNEGPIPGWAQEALRTGDYEGLSRTDIEYVQSLKEMP